MQRSGTRRETSASPRMNGLSSTRPDQEDCAQACSTEHQEQQDHDRHRSSSLIDKAFSDAEYAGYRPDSATLIAIACP